MFFHAKILIFITIIPLLSCTAFLPIFVYLAIFILNPPPPKIKLFKILPSLLFSAYFPHYLLSLGLGSWKRLIWKRKGNVVGGNWGKRRSEKRENIRVQGGLCSLPFILFNRESFFWLLWWVNEKKISDKEKDTYLGLSPP